MQLSIERNGYIYMNNETGLLKSEEKSIYKLRSLYEKYGYTQYKMSKFEEYDLYVRNKDFLVSDNIITFTDTNGKLMALKPDVTLSIIKNTKDNIPYTQKVYYNENVYRVSKSTDSFKEIMQVGLECIGNVDDYCIYEVLSLAAESLAVISDDFVLDISHMGIIADIIKKLELPMEAEREVLKCLGEKNTHGIEQICKENCADETVVKQLTAIVATYGTASEVMPKLKSLLADTSSTAVNQLETLVLLLENKGYAERIHIDFSVVNHMGYYNGIVFRGFINGIPAGILSGGQYDKLMKKMHRKSGAIGFAVYPDMLEQITADTSDYDVDTVILYDDSTDLKALSDAVNMFTQSGKSVMTQREIPGKIKYKQLLKMLERGVEIVETNA